LSEVKWGVVVLAWTKISGRQVDLAYQFSGEAKIVFPDRVTNNKIVRYLLSAVQTIIFLRRGSYRVLIVTAPPIETALICAVFRRIGKPLILDSHPGAFGLMGNARSRKEQFLHRWLWRRAALVLVTTEELVKTVNAGGGHALVFHEPFARWQELEEPSVPTDVPGSTHPIRVFVPFIFARDEPVEVLLSVARRLQDIEFRVTGNPDQLPDDTAIPPNVTLVGFLGQEQYLSEMKKSDIVIVLSTERESVMRTAYEAIRMGRSLVVSKSEATLKYFPYALHAENTETSIIAALMVVIEEDNNLSLQRRAAAIETSRKITNIQTEALRTRVTELSHP
jgi:glycosyltransferase involved in cell wall biosynthesis